MICRFNNHFLSIVAAINAAFPPYLWDLLLPQAKLIINLLCQATANPKILVWEYCNGPFKNFNKTPLSPVGCRVFIHAEPGNHRSWDYRAKHVSTWAQPLTTISVMSWSNRKQNRKSSLTMCNFDMLTCKFQQSQRRTRSSMAYE